MKFKKESLTVSVGALFNTGGSLKDSELFIEYEKDGEREWFDLKNAESDIVCMDGETCEIIEVYDNYDVLLKNTDGESVKEFTLSEKEFLIATGINVNDLIECDYILDSYEVHIEEVEEI